MTALGASLRRWLGIEEEREGRSTLLFLALILVLALILRFWHVDAQSLWYDEGWSVHLAREGVRSALAQAASAGHTHPPGYYLLLMAWVRLVGSSVIAVRGLSALLGLFTVLGLYRLGTVLFDRSTGLTAAFFLAIAPAHIIYSQEARMYALLALCFTVLLGFFYRLGADDRPWSRGDWITLAFWEIAAIYTHYFAFFLLIGMSAWLLPRLVVYVKEGRPRPRRWLGVQGIALLAFLPWLAPALARAKGHVSLGAAPPRIVPFLLQNWSFLLGGHIGLYGREPAFAFASKALLGIAALSVVILYMVEDHRRETAYLVLQGLLPLVLLFALMRVRPGFHPRYILMLIVPLILVMGHVVVAFSRRRMGYKALGLLVACGWLGATGLAAHALLADSYYARDDARGVVSYLNETLDSGAVVLMDMEDWALHYYFDETDLADVYIDASQSPERVGMRVASVLEGRSRAAQVKWHQGETDRRGMLPYLLESRGRRVDRHRLGGYTVHIWSLSDEISSLVSKEPGVRFGPLRLLEAKMEPSVPVGEAVPISLAWKKEETISRDYKVALSLVDQKGRTLARCDEPMVDSVGRGTGDWEVGRWSVNYHTLDLRPGIAPLAYAVRVLVYHEGQLSGLDVLDEAGAPAGKYYDIGTVELTRSVEDDHRELGREALGLRLLPQPARVANGLYIVSYGLSESSLRAGDTLSLLIEWHSTEGDLPSYHPVLQLTRAGEVLIKAQGAPVYGDYPTSLWRADEVVLEWRDLVVPADTEPGDAQVMIRVADEPPVILGGVRIEDVRHDFEPPSPQVGMAQPIGPFELVGYDFVPLHDHIIVDIQRNKLPDVELTAGEPISLTLYWQGEATVSENYVVFTHLLDEEGKLVAQHDGPPAGGARPTAGWVKGEYVVDSHRLAWLDADYAGRAVLEVGFYEPTSGERLRTPRGESRLLLPSEIVVR
ncbi:MAG: glycosyltransferase family 39 protein [Chloroflexota bacterium]|nr:glycosyltransferase family 39 protein [Chloroflexota bacterium]